VFLNTKTAGTHKISNQITLRC